MGNKHNVVIFFMVVIFILVFLFLLDERGRQSTRHLSSVLEVEIQAIEKGGVLEDDEFPPPPPLGCCCPQSKKER
jgi:hypothetical protein